MARVLRVTRLAANPRKVKRRKKNARRHNKRRMSVKQIKIFGTKRQKAALKRSLSAKRAHNRRGAKRHARHTRRRVSNPAPIVLTLGATNPKKRRNTTVAAKRKHHRRRTAVHHKRRRVAHNPKRRRVYHRRRTHNKRRRNTRVVVVSPRHNRRRHKRNPSLFGHSLTSKDTLKLIGGGLVGVAAAKFIPTVLPTSVLGSVATSTIGKVLITGVSAVAAGFLAAKLDKDFGSGVLFGGLMQTASVGLNAFMPSFSIGGVPIALSGMGDLLPGQYAVPQNPIRAAIPPPAPPAPPPGARITMNGLSRAYGVAYGR